MDPLLAAAGLLLTALLALLAIFARGSGRTRHLSAAHLAVAQPYAEHLATSPPATSPSPSTADPRLRDRIAALVDADRRVKAIELLRDHGGLSLAEAKRVVDDLGRQRRPTVGRVGHLAYGPREAAPVAGGMQIDPRLRAQVYDLKRRGRIVGAVELLRDNTGWRLAEAKSYVDRL